MVKLCMGCMEQLSQLDDQTGVCPYCGYVAGTEPDESYYLKPGTILNERYLIGKVLGYGGYGITYIGYDLSLKRKVAVKEFFPGDFATRCTGSKNLTIYSGEAGDQFRLGLDSFMSEARRLAQLIGTPGIVNVYDCGFAYDTGYIIMEFLSGQTVKEMLETNERFSVQEAGRIILQVLDGLELVHRVGIIHRDVSPDNIFVTEAGEVKLIDFGAARTAISTFSESLSVILKPGYAPEEQYRSHGMQGPWTDVYGAGATFYRMITGVCPEDAIERRMNDNLQLPSSMGVKLPETVEKVLMDSLQVCKKDRIQTAAEFRDRLKAGLDNMHDEKEENVNKWQFEKKSIYRWLIGIVCVGAAITISFFMGRGGNQKRKYLIEVDSFQSEQLQTETSEMKKESEQDHTTGAETDSGSEPKFAPESQTMLLSETEPFAETEFEKVTEKGTAYRLEQAQTESMEMSKEFEQDQTTRAETESESELKSGSEPQTILLSETELVDEMEAEKITEISEIDNVGGLPLTMYEKKEYDNTMDEIGDYQFEDLSIGDVITFGMYEQDNNLENGKESVEWIVLDKKEEKILLISKYGIDARPYHNDWSYKTWENCSLREWLNEEFLKNTFSTEEQKYIALIQNENPDNPVYNTSGGKNTSDRVFVLSYAEIERYIPKPLERTVINTKYADTRLSNMNDENEVCYWLRTGGTDDCQDAMVVNLDGTIDYNGKCVDKYEIVCPAVWIYMNVND